MRNTLSFYILQINNFRQKKNDYVYVYINELTSSLCTKKSMQKNLQNLEKCKIYLPSLFLCNGRLCQYFMPSLPLSTIVIYNYFWKMLNHFILFRHL